MSKTLKQRFGQAINCVDICAVDTKVYQSALQQPIAIAGTGFKESMAFAFDPTLTAGVDYEFEYQSTNKVKLHLKPGKRWRAAAGVIIVKTLTMNDQVHRIGNDGEGIRVAIVLADPMIITSQQFLHESQSFEVIIVGNGFTRTIDMKLTLHPMSRSAYDVEIVNASAINLTLKPGHTWLPSFLTLKDDTSRTENSNSNP